MRAVIIGCGETGLYLVNEYSKKGYNISVVDKDERAFDKLPHNLNGVIKVVGDATDMDVLQHSFLASADIALVVTGDDDVNIMISQIAKKYFNVKNVAVMISNAEKIPIFKDIDVKVICPAEMIISQFKE